MNVHHAVLGNQGFALPSPGIKDGGFLMLPRQWITEMGPAMQTLGAMYRLTAKDGSTFAAVGTIARWAHVSPSAVKRHLKALRAAGLVTYHGRQLFPGSNYRYRRTVTYKITKKAISDDHKPYTTLPVWACKVLPTWAERSVLAAVVSRSSLIEYLEKTNGDASDRDHMSLGDLQSDTGLSRKSVSKALRDLQARRLVWHGYPDGEFPGATKGVILTVCYRLPDDHWTQASPEPDSPLGEEKSEPLGRGILTQTQGNSGPGVGEKWPASLERTNNTTPSRTFETQHDSLRKPCDVRFLSNISKEQLASVKATDELSQHAVTAGIITCSEDDRIKWHSAAVHALAVGENPPALFRHIITECAWDRIPNDAEAEASRRLKPDAMTPEQVKERQRSLLASLEECNALD